MHTSGREEGHSGENVLATEMHTNGRDNGDEWKQVNRDEQGGDQAVPVHQITIKNYFQFHLVLEITILKNYFQFHNVLELTSNHYLH